MHTNDEPIRTPIRIFSHESCKKEYFLKNEKIIYTARKRKTMYNSGKADL